MDKIDEIIQKALDAFWTEVVRHFPESDSGDFPYEADEKFGRTALAAVKLWIEKNPAST